MSGFERSNSPERHDASGADERPWPDDFTLEDEQFAAELRACFPIEDEELPPLYIQTLLDDDVQAPLNRGDLRRLTYQVKRRLGLPRKPLLTHQWAPSAWADQVSVEHVTRAVKRAGRPLVALVALLVFCMVSSMYLATPSFAQGLRLLFGDTGAQQVIHYPDNVAPEKHITPTSAQSAQMPTFWLGTTSGDYVYQGMRTLTQEQYSRGPILDVQYVLSERTDQQTGSGMLDIREFQISTSLSAVLQSVQEGSTSLVSVNGLNAVYVDGMWVTAPGQRTAWQTGSRSMLIFERDGVIFWIVGDQRDGLGEAQLVQAASQMAPTTMSSLVQSNLLSVRLVGAELSASLRDPIGYNTEVYTLIPRSASPDTAAGEFVTPGPPPQSPQSPLN
ncbi:MAG TPA: hypothetical protein VID72_03850 [Ktedonobacterales bacterium]